MKNLVKEILNEMVGLWTTQHHEIEQSVCERLEQFDIYTEDLGNKISVQLELDDEDIEFIVEYSCVNNTWVMDDVMEV